MNLKLKARFSAIVLLYLCSISTHASTIETLSSWNLKNGVGNFGEDNYGGNIDSGVYATYGQTFNMASDIDNALQSITFYVNDHWTIPDPIHFGIYLYKWDGSKIFGDALFESGPLSTTQSNDFEEFTVSTGGIYLNTGTNYVAFMSASNYFDGNIGFGTTGLTSNPYLDGEYVYMNNKDDFTKLSTSSWGSIGSIDLAFQLNFTPVPIPPSLPLLAFGLVSLLGFSKYNKHNKRSHADKMLASSHFSGAAERYASLP